MAFIKIFTIIAITSLVSAEYDDEHSVGYSYAKFSGPVSGPAKEVVTHDKHHGTSVDYIAKPDYQFEYGVEDPKSHVSQFRKENRHDDAVVGEYSYTDPLGHVRLVKYTADKVHGFRAEIYVDGKLEQPHGSQAVPQENHHHHPSHQQARDYDSHDEVKEEEGGDYDSNEY
ncbi:larval cuticle protein A2B [Chironomus tepperi]|uniref:larval cuticle protein A2B n=1 Tax=Chironomus tepperi TaxID=113505 RepID=UPI00391FC682